MKIRKDDPIIAIATGSGNGGIGIVRISGSDEDICTLMEILFPQNAPQPRRAELKSIKDRDGQVIDRGIILYFPAPHSYNGESILELQIHGGKTVLSWILEEILEQGSSISLRKASPGEFTERAFLNGKLDLAQAEAVADLIEATSKSEAKAAARSLKGEFSAEVHGLEKQITDLRVIIEAILDFPEEEEIDFLSDYDCISTLNKIKVKVNFILSQARQGEILRDGLRVAIIGETNVGKSSLLNHLAGEEVAIVSDVAGTTRDKIQTTIKINDIPFHFIDTAGIRTTTDKVELIGIERTKEEIKKADILLVIQDLSRCKEDATELSLQDIPELSEKSDIPVLRVFNKSDLISQNQKEKLNVSRETFFLTSALTGDGISRLKEKLVSIADVSREDSLYLARERHVLILKEVKEKLDIASEYLKDDNPQLDIAAQFLKEAADSLGEITGRISSDGLLGRIFNSFCIGK